MKLADKSVSKIVFLKTRTVKLQGAASLISNGPLGSVNFWNIFQGGKLSASFKPSRTGCQVSSLAVTKDNSLMFVADYIGYIYVYNIKDYAIQGPEKDRPPFIKHWRAHVDMVTELEVIDEDKVVLSSSLDCTARLWSIDGEFIGTFGQEDPWEVFTPASWKHPMVPYEILIDPESMPVHPVLEQPTDEPEEVTSQEEEEPQETSDIKNEINYNAKSLLLTITEEDIQEEINKQNLSCGSGKRLRHEKYKIAHKPLDHGGPNAFHNLQYFNLESNSVTFEKPDMSVAGTDPFQSFVSS
ncbi:WD repeat-containing protein on Y chromosome-like [Dendropsophus ebraccatus]|uniref:WD repeat-containing protein on Y chromosome-like n=1 Tax=Dendropsophus ebraccatus TaxID=150705 RepID=UPI0038322539